MAGVGEVVKGRHVDRHVDQSSLGAFEVMSPKFTKDLAYCAGDRKLGKVALIWVGTTHYSLFMAFAQP